MKVRPREAADQAAAQAFLARHNSLRGARLGELVHPLDHPALVAETAGGQLAGMLTYVPGHDWRQCEILTLHAAGQWHGAGTALIEAVEQLAVQHRLPAIYSSKYLASDGGLMAYGVNPTNIFRQGAAIVAKVLRGSKPAEVPAERTSPLR